MSTTAADTIARPSATKVCPSFGTALEVLEVKAKDKIKKEAAEDAARVLKATFRSRIPIEPIGIAEELGIRVVEIDLDEDILGMLLIKPGVETKIYLNQRDGVIRQRLACGLELGNYVRHSAQTNKFGRLDRITDRSTLKEDPDLIYAEEFAACLLMPPAEFNALLELGVDDLEIALRFQVPREMVQRKLEAIGVRTADLLEA
jgi:Zn-dependent peptidase ImmA (M78 family)